MKQKEIKCNEIEKIYIKYMPHTLGLNKNCSWMSANQNFLKFYKYNIWNKNNLQF